MKEVYKIRGFGKEFYKYQISQESFDTRGNRVKERFVFVVFFKEEFVFYNKLSLGFLEGRGDGFQIRKVIENLMFLGNWFYSFIFSVLGIVGL